MTARDRATKSISLTVGRMRVGSGGVHETGATSRSELDRLASPDRADQYLAPAPIRAPGLCHPTCPNRTNYPVLSDL